MPSVMKRIIAAIGAGAVGQLINIVIQLFSLPLFLERWNPEIYGTWLILSSIPAYLSMADIGMTATAGNRMTMAVSRNDTPEANRIFHSATVFLLLICAVVLVISVPVTLWAPLTSLTNSDQRLALAALIAGVILNLLGGLCDALFRATNRYALGMMCGNLTRLLEWTGYMVGLFAFGTFAGVAICGLVVRLICLLLTIALSAAGGHTIKWHWRSAHLDEIRQMAKPAISFMAFPLANALSLQGITLLVGHFFGPATVAIFNTYRTISRVSVQLTGIFGHSLWVEFSTLYGKGDHSALQHLYRRAYLIGVGISAGLSVVLFFAAPSILQIWSHGQIPFEPWPMVLLLAYAAAGGFWHVPRVLLLATNQHVGLAQWALLAAATCIAMALAFRAPFGLEGACAAMLVSELMIAAICTRLAQQATPQPYSSNSQVRS